MTDIESASGVAGAGSVQQQTAPPAADTSAASSRGGPGRFKIVGRVVMAMKRFQASLNPTYTPGKRPSSDSGDEHNDGHRVVVRPPQAGTQARTTSGRTTSGRTLSGRPLSAGQQHGYKANLLFRPLPEPDTAVRSG